VPAHLMSDPKIINVAKMIQQPNKNLKYDCVCYV
jgi:hypothetical protein